MPPNNYSVSAAPSILIASATSAANTAGVATATAAAGFKYVVRSFDVSTSGTIAAGVAATLVRTHGATTRTATYGIPAAQVMPFGVAFGATGLDTDEASTVTATCPALGAGVVSYVNVYGVLVAVR